MDLRVPAITEPPLARKGFATQPQIPLMTALYRADAAPDASELILYSGPPAKVVAWAYSPTVEYTVRVRALTVRTDRPAGGTLLH